MFCHGLAWCTVWKTVWLILRIWEWQHSAWAFLRLAIRPSRSPILEMIWVEHRPQFLALAGHLTLRSAFRMQRRRTWAQLLRVKGDLQICQRLSTFFTPRRFQRRSRWCSLQLLFLRFLFISGGSNQRRAVIFGLKLQHISYEFMWCHEWVLSIQVHGRHLGVICMRVWWRF